MVRFLKYLRMFSFQKSRCFSQSNSVKVANVLENAYQTILNLENVFSILIVRFFAEGLKTSKFEKRLQNLMKKFFNKKRFGPFEKHRQQNCSAEIIPVVAGRVVILSNKARFL